MDIFDIITYSTIYYYSLITNKVLDHSRIASNIKRTIIQMWNEYTLDINCVVSIDSIGILTGEYSEVFGIKSDLLNNIIFTLNNYQSKCQEIDTTMEVFELFYADYFPGMKITHSQIINIIDFYSNN